MVRIEGFTLRPPLVSASPTPANGASKDGFDFHVAKPVDGEHLARLLGESIQRRPSQ